MKPKILAFAGSTHTDSFNKKLVKIVAAGAKEADADVTVIDLRDFQMSLYDEDLERQEGLSPNTRKLKEFMLSYHVFLISSPEYNSSISGVLKNTLDWTSRQSDGESISCFKDKVAGLMNASPSRLGGLRELVYVRTILENMGILVIPKQIAISKAHEAFNSNGPMKEPKQEQQIKSIGANLSQILLKLNA